MKKNFGLNESFLFCMMAGAPLKTPTDWIHYAETQLRGDRSQSLMSMTIETPDWNRTLEIKANIEGRDQSLVVIQSPAKEKGVATLRLKNQMWNYFPKLKRTITVSPSMLLSSWMGSDFTNDDLLKASSFFEDYNHQFLEDQVSGAEKMKVINHSAKSDAKVIWPKVIALFSQKDCLPREYHYYNKKNELLRKLILSDYAKFDNQLAPTKWVIYPMASEGKKTTLVYKDLHFKISFPENFFTQQNLTSDK